MTPINYYYKHCRDGLITEDPQQIKALTYLTDAYTALLAEQKRRAAWYRLLRTPKAQQGVYLWGGVGIGKTYVMDCFYHCLPFTNKMRLHFHSFMKFIHEALKTHQGEKNPLAAIAKQLAKQTMVLCLDELHVTDITDAMILRRLFEALHANGITLIITSNLPPDELYKRGLQRPLFIPAIELIKSITNVLHVTTDIDYRTQHLQHAGTFYIPDDDIAEENMEKSFAVLSEQGVYETNRIELHGRSIAVRRRTNNVIWFDFKAICGKPRSQWDYLTLVETYQTILISHVPQIEADDKDTVSLFIRMIDVFYDARIRLVCSCATEIDDLYHGTHMQFEFKRAQSRLLEMQRS